MVVNADELRPMLRPEIESFLIDLAHRHYQGGRVAEELDARLAAAGLAATGPDKDAPAPDPAALDDLAGWARETLDLDVSAARPPGPRARRRSATAWSPPSTPSIAPRCARWRRPSCSRSSTRAGWNTSAPWTISAARSASRDTPRSIPRSSTSARGCASSPRCGAPVADRVTDLIFRVEHFDPDFLDYLGSRYNKLDRAQTIHQQVESQLVAAPAPAGSASSRTRRSPAASNRPRRSASQSATLEKRWAETTRARAAPVKSSKRAACGSTRPPTRSDPGRRTTSTPAERIGPSARPDRQSQVA